MTLVSQATDEQRNVALLQAVGADKLNPAQRELFLAIARNYNLDPMLKHLVMIEGRPYITRDGLLHVAHVSGQLDGIETTDPALDEDGAFWRCKASVYRKDMTRPFTYTGRYPAKGRNQQYAPEMAVKVAEVMSLRRAFDVAAPTREEQWVDEAPEADHAPAPGPVSLSERIAARAETVAPPEPALERIETAETVEGDSTDAPVVPGQFPGVPIVEVDDSETSDVSLLGGPTLEEFGELMKDVPKQRIRAIAKRLFPDASKFADLTPVQLQSIIDEVIADDERQTDADPTPTSGESPTTTPPEVTATGPGESTVEMCGMESPYGTGLTCSQDKGHPATVPHRAGLRETW